MLLPFAAPIWLYQQPVDFRKQMDGLIVLIASHLKQDPTSGQLFLFRNKHANKIKLLWYDGNGFWLCYKRLEQAKFIFPSIADQTLKLSREQLSWLLSGLNFQSYMPLSVVNAKHFY